MANKTVMTEEEQRALEAMTAYQVVEYLSSSSHLILKPEVAKEFAKKLGINKVPVTENITNPNGDPKGAMLDKDESITGVSVMFLVPWMCRQLGIDTAQPFLGRGQKVRELCRRLQNHLERQR